jgi:hypothetical protein
VAEREGEMGKTSGASTEMPPWVQIGAEIRKCEAKFNGAKSPFSFITLIPTFDRSVEHRW